MMVHNKLAAAMMPPAAANLPRLQRHYDILLLYEGERLSEFQEKVLRIIDEIR
jgi:hypothetical protein